MRKWICLFLFVLVIISGAKAQSVAINTDGTTAGASAILDIKSTTRVLSYQE